MIPPLLSNLDPTSMITVLAHYIPARLAFPLLLWEVTYIKPQGLSHSKSPLLENSCLCKVDSAYRSGLRKSISFFRANFLAISNVDPIVTTSSFSFIFKNHLTLAYILLFISLSPSYSLLYFVHHFVYEVHSRHSTDILKWINKYSLHIWINRCIRAKNW